MIDVVCVLWGDKYSDYYVRILKAMVERNTTFEHRFICFSDREVEGVDCRPLIYEDLQGWWQKIYLFKEGNKLNERVVYFDLDTVITGNIDWLMKYRGAFMGIENLGVNNHKYEDVTQYKGVLQSGVMAWNFPRMTTVWTTFDLPQNKANILANCRGDGEFLHALFKANNKQPKFIQHRWPGKLRSYKYECYENGLPEGTSIVCFHGEPSPYQAIHETVTPWGTVYEPREWVAEYWKM